MQDTPRRRTNSAHVAHVPARLQATWAVLVRQRGVFCVDKIYIFEIAMKNCSKYPSPVKIRDVAGTPSSETGMILKWDSSETQVRLKWDIKEKQKQPD